MPSSRLIDSLKFPLPEDNFHLILSIKWIDDLLNAWSEDRTLLDPFTKKG